MSLPIICKAAVEAGRMISTTAVWQMTAALARR
jgi:hypothetical protein